MAFGVDVDPKQHGRPDMIDRARFPNAGGVVVYEVFLEIFDLLVGQNDFGKFSDAGVYTVHDFSGLDPFLDKPAASVYSFNRLRMEFHFFTPPGHAHNIVNGQFFPGYLERHQVPPSLLYL
jgi:hypothetical protein